MTKEKRSSKVDPWKLIELRDKKGLSREKLAQKSKVAPRSIEGWERGNHRITDNKLHPLCKALGCNPEDITLKDEEEFEDEEI